VSDSADDDHDQAPLQDRSAVLLIRSSPVMLASSVAQAFGVETREVTQAVKRNPTKFGPDHAFELSNEEVEFLTSQGVISKPGRGGSRALPWVFTQKGVVRLSTVIDSSRALAAVDTMIDIFIEVYQQLARGGREVEIANPSRLSPAGGDQSHLQNFRKKLLAALDGLLNTVIDPKGDVKVRDELGELGGGALAHLKEQMRTKGLENEKIEAETLLIIEKAREIRDKTQAEVRKSHAEAERIVLENLNTKITIVERLMKMAKEMEPNAVIQLLGEFSAAHLTQAPALVHRTNDDSES
jgi:hypothetical protein